MEGDTMGNPQQASFLSLLASSSRELFHSNFLYAIGRKYPSFFVYLFAGVGDAETSSVQVVRERKFIDIQFSFSHPSGKRHFILENKVKSVATVEQLAEYSDKYPTSKKILLAPYLPKTFQPKDSADSYPTFDVDGHEWIYVSYGNVCAKLREGLTNGVFQPDEAVLVEEYVDYVTQLLPTLKQKA